VITEMRATMSDVTRDLRSRLDALERTLGGLPEGTDRAPIAGDMHALREMVDRLEGVERDERHQFGHDLRVPLNAIAGWTHILRLDASSTGTVQRAVDVFERNVRALTRLIETYTTEGDGR
jgi:signal transduction histidine kinase